MSIHKLGDEMSIAELNKEYLTCCPRDVMPDEQFKKERLTGQMCACEDDGIEPMFVLLPESSVAVQQGGKRYMICLNCGQSSHL